MGKSFLTLANYCSGRCLTRIVLSLVNSGIALTKTRKLTTCIFWRMSMTMRRAMRFVYPSGLKNPRVNPSHALS
jgi:hypothetical protein